MLTVSLGGAALVLDAEAEGLQHARHHDGQHHHREQVEHLWTHSS